MDSSAQSHQRKLVDGFKRDLHEGLVCSNPLNGSWVIIPFYLSLRLELTIHQLPLGGWIRLRNPTNGNWVDGFKRAIPSTKLGGWIQARNPTNGSWWMDSSATYMKD